MKVVKLPLSKLVTDKANPREDMEDIDELADSLEKGQEVPINVEDLKDGRYLVNNGHRRYNAYKVLKKRTNKEQMVDCIVENKLTPEERLIKQAKIDVQTKNWNVEERDAAWEKIWNTGKYTKEKFRKLLGASSTTVTNFLDRQELGDEVMSLDIGSDVISETKALDPETRKKFLKKAAEEGYGCRETRAIVKAIKDASQNIKDKVIDGSINIHQAQQLKGLKEDKQELAIDTIKHMNKQIKTIPKLVQKDKITSKKVDEGTRKLIQLQEFIDRLQEEIGNASSQMLTIEGVLKQVTDEKLDNAFTPKLKTKLASVLEELKETIEPTTERIEKTIKKWRK